MEKYRDIVASFDSIRCFFIGIFLTCIWTPMTGQNLIYDHYAIREGLSNRLIRDIAFDGLDLVWIATGNGLNRFDGYDFVTFSTSEQLEPDYRLSQSYVNKLATAADGRLIVFYEDLYSSFDFFDPVSFKVEKIEVSLKVGGQPRGFFVDDDGNIFVVSREENFTAISVYDYQANDFTELCRLFESWKRQHPIIDLLVDQSGRFILYDQEHGLRTCLTDTRDVRYYDKTIPGGMLNATHLAFIHEDQENRTWLAFNHVPGVYQLDTENDSLSIFSPLSTDGTYADVWEDDAGNLLFNNAETVGNFALSRQLLCLTQNGKILDFSRLLEVGNYILTIRSKDFFRTLLIGSDTGLKVVQNATSRIGHYVSMKIGEDRRGFSMRGMCVDGEGGVYFAREVEAWYKLDKETNLVDTILLQDKYGNYLHFNSCQGIWYDPQGFLWGITGDGTDRRVGYLHKYDLANCNTETFTYTDAFTAYGIVDNDTYYLGTRSDEGTFGLVLFDRQSQIFYPVYDKDGNNPFEKAHIRYILPKDGKLWIGSEQGIFWVDPATGTYRHFVKGGKGKNGKTESVNLSDNTVFSIYPDKNGLVWFGTLNGLTSYDHDNEKWAVYTTKDGLVSNTIASILPGQEGNALWVSTYNGLSYFTPNQDDSRSFFQIDGLTHNEFNRFSSLLDSDGSYYFGGVNGVNTFTEEELLVSRSIPKVLLTGFSHYDEKLDSIIVVSANLLENPSVVIEPHYSYFSFDFALPIYTPTTNNRFRYRIGDADTEWIYLKGDRSLRYNDIKSGNYKIHVQGADANGNWGKESLIIHVLVKEVFYKTTWFIALMIFFGGTLIYGLLRYRLEEKLRMERLRTQLASDLHDEVSGLLAGISLQSELLRSQIKDSQIDQKLQNIRQASQRAMSKMSDVIWSIDSRRDRLSELINRMEEHADEVLLPIEIRYNLKTFQLDTDGPIPANIRQNIYFIYKEAINNVAKHARASKVDIWMGNKGNQFELRIIDDGQGVHDNGESKTKQRKGQGLANLKMRAQRLGAEIDILNGQGFTIQLKMKRFI